MAQVLAVKGTKLLIQIGDGGSPEQFGHPCVINTDRSFALNAEVADFQTYDCSDPEGLSWAQREKTTLSADISGGGRLHAADLKEWDTWFRSPYPKNVRITIDAAKAVGGGHWQGQYHLTGFEITGGDKSSVIEVSVTLQSTGEVSQFVEAVA